MDSSVGASETFQTPPLHPHLPSEERERRIGLRERERWIGSRERETDRVERERDG